MDNTNYIALSRQMALWKQMDLVSNNMANMNTAGYKGDEALFTTYLAETQNGAKDIVGNPLYFTQDYASYKNFAEGMIAHTGNRLDAAIQGDAFFTVETPNGEMYTKKGQFSLDADGAIVTSEGYYLMSEGNTPFFIAPGETEITITESGEIFTENGSIGRMKLASFDAPQELQKVGNSLFSNDGTAGASFNADNSVVKQYSIEKSNVNSINEMTKLINLQRSYDYVQQMIDEEHQRLSNIIDTFSQLA